MAEQKSGAPRHPRPGGGPGHGGAALAMPVERSANFWPIIKRLIGLLRPERLGMITVLGFTVLSVTLSVIGPRILGAGTDLIFSGVVSARLPAGTTKEQVVDQLRAAGDTMKADMIQGMDLVPGAGIDFGQLRNVLLGVLAIYVLASLFGYLQGYLLNGVVQRTMYRLRRDVEATLNKVPLSYTDRMQRGELLSRVTNDIDNVAQSLQQTLAQLLTSVLTVVGIVVMMVVTSPLLTIIAVVSIPIMLFVTRAIAKRSQKHFIAQWKHTGELNAHVEENYTGHSLVKVFGHTKTSRKEFADLNSELYEASFKAQFISGIIMPAMMFVGNLVYVAIAVVGGIQVAGGHMSLGRVQAFIQYSRQFTQPLSQIGAMMNLLQSGVASAERVFEVLDAEPQRPDPVNPETAAGTHGHLVFDHVKFSYTPDEPLIEDLSFEAKPGQTIAIVGPTGAGKTTLVNLIMRFYELDGGRITLDDVDISKMTRADLRSRTGMVLQDTWLFAGTIRDNIAYGRIDATDEEIIDAARATYVDRFVRSLPDGYDTVLNDEATNISIGQKQLITIARAYLARPSILILDEATSSVDTRTEVLVQKAMNALRADRTSFVIAHRLSTIRDADLILVMNRGAIVEQGTHAELIALGGAYADLYEAQFAAPATDEVTG
ncbi:ABC transporter ATP-binding protein [Rarobacter incanus]|uniref:Fatty acid ABC transporter ATP-binding/permease protein n=1 Tax=Rarobacter incanus TaxID=153494 RepID=A0A542SMN5_9MICO|nr:ABC transporter ATP-binding protein [Rarobacter incanus]TQK75882.1 ATP-binding cassette subfamily B protein [Rarobacter incanus]